MGSPGLPAQSTHTRLHNPAPKMHQEVPNLGNIDTWGAVLEKIFALQ
jgi:hypothetical protein